MANETLSQVQQIVAQAVGQAYEAWAAQHPSLAAVIDRVLLTQRTVESLRESAEYRQAVDAFHRDQNELGLLKQLIELAAPLLAGLLAA